MSVAGKATTAEIGKLGTRRLAQRKLRCKGCGFNFFIKDCDECGFLFCSWCDQQRKRLTRDCLCGRIQAVVVEKEEPEETAVAAFRPSLLSLHSDYGNRMQLSQSFVPLNEDRRAELPRGQFVETTETRYYETREDQALWISKENGDKEPQGNWTRQWRKILDNGRETRFPTDKIYKLRSNNIFGSTHSISDHTTVKGDTLK